MRILGIDYGKSKLGLAITDPTNTISQPFSVIPAKDAISKIENIAKEYSVELFVVGLPILESGEEGKMAEEVRKFAKALAEATGKKVILWDERYSSHEAEKILKEAGLSWRKYKKRKLVDKLSAALILESFLEKRNEASRG